MLGTCCGRFSDWIRQLALTHLCLMNSMVFPRRVVGFLVEQHTGLMHNDNFRHKNLHTVIDNATKNFSIHVSSARMFLFCGGLVFWWCSKWLMSFLISNALMFCCHKELTQLIKSLFRIVDP